MSEMKILNFSSWKLEFLCKNFEFYVKSLNSESEGNLKMEVGGRNRDTEAMVDAGARDTESTVLLGVRCIAFQRTPTD